MEARSQLRHRPTRWVGRVFPLLSLSFSEPDFVNRTAKLAHPAGIHFGEDTMEEKVGIGSTLIVLLVVAAILVLAGWFVWSKQSQHPTPTAPKPASELLQPPVQSGTSAQLTRTA